MIYWHGTLYFCTDKVVSSLGWPCISRYRASVCTLSPRVEIIDSLFKPQGNEDRGLIRWFLLKIKVILGMSTMTIIFPNELLLGTCTCFSELLFDFYLSSGKQRPEQVIIFRFVTHLKAVLNFAVLAVEVSSMKTVSCFFVILFVEWVYYRFISGMELVRASLSMFWTLSWHRSLR